MSDTDEHDQNDDAGLEISDEDAERLLEDPEDVDSGTDDPGDSRDQRRSDGDDPAQREIAKWKSMARKHEREAKQRASKLKEYEDANKTESQRLQDSASEFRTRAETAETQLKRLQIALSVAPEHASFPTLQKVIRRMAGNDDDELEEDARELWADYAPAAPKESPPKTSQRPKERLRPGNTDPEEDDEETDPRKLADSIRRNR